MRPRLVDTPAPHGALGVGIAVLVFGIAGLMVLTAAVASGWLPSWLPGATGAGGAPLRLAVGALGIGLLATGLGFLRFRRWAWWGGLTWAGWSVVEVARSLDPVVGAIPLPQFLAACAIPYLWIRRRDFGVGGRASRRAGRGLPSTGFR